MSPAQQMLNTGWTSWIWLTCAMGPMASPWYQAKKPRNMLTTPRYAKAAHCTGVAEGGCPAMESAARHTIEGRRRTSAQETVCQAPSSRASWPPSA